MCLSNTSTTHLAPLSFSCWFCGRTLTTTFRLVWRRLPQAAPPHWSSSPVPSCAETSCAAAEIGWVSWLDARLRGSWSWWQWWLLKGHCGPLTAPSFTVHTLSPLAFPVYSNKKHYGPLSSSVYGSFKSFCFFLSRVGKDASVKENLTKLFLFHLLFSSCTL